MTTATTVCFSPKQINRGRGPPRTMMMMVAARCNEGAGDRHAIRISGTPSKMGSPGTVRRRL